jgi:hypothetical protein
MYLCIYTRVNCERHRNNKELYYYSDDYHSENLEYCWKMNHDYVVIVTQFRCSRDEQSFRQSGNLRGINGEPWELP